VKCLECDSYRGWRRIFFASSTTLSLLIALFSVLGIVIPVLMKACTADSNVAVRVIGYREPNPPLPGVILVSAANSGRQPGLVHSISLDLKNIHVQDVANVPIENRGGAFVSGEKESALELNIDGLHFAEKPDKTLYTAEEVDKALCAATTTLSLTAKVEECDWRGNREVVDRRDPTFAAILIRKWVMKRLPIDWQESTCQ